MKPLPFAQARINQRENPASTWYIDGKKSSEKEIFAYDRVGESFVPINVVPKFLVPAKGVYFMIGSCFARGLEKTLVHNGLDVRSISSEFDRWSIVGIGTPLGATNRYNTGAILNEFRWALDPDSPFPPDAIVDIDASASIDPHMNPILKVENRATTLERRDIYAGVMKHAASADVIIMTLGYVETWIDTRFGICTNVTPDPRIVRKDPERFVFKRLTYNENMENLEALHALLAKYGKPGHKIVVTVSPVPLLTTFTNEDVIVANTYSKNTLRAVTTDFVEMHDNVDYFPSYEMVMNAKVETAWLPDKRHVRGDLAHQVMTLFVRKWVTEGEHRQLKSADLSAVY